jgi:hypothetical protein
MKRSRFLRLLAMAFISLVVAAGLQRGGSPVAVAGRAAVPHLGGGEGVFSVTGSGFVSGDSTNTYSYVVYGGVQVTGAAAWPAKMTASVELPSGATVANLVLYYRDENTTPGDDVVLYLRRYSGSGGWGLVASTDSSANDGISFSTSSNTFFTTVDNQSFSYMLLAEMHAIDVVLFGAKVNYTLPSTTSSAVAEERERPIAPSGQRVASADLSLERVQELDSQAAQARGGEVFPAVTPRASESLAAWRSYAAAGAAFHPLSSGSTHYFAAGGGRYVASGTTDLVVPLNLIHGRSVHQARFTYYDTSTSNPFLSLYQVDRQGGASVLWYNVPHESGGYFTAVSPHLGFVVDNANYAYFFLARLGGSAAGGTLRAMEIEVVYDAYVYLPLILRDE